MELPRPVGLFDREREWDDLAGFVRRDDPHLLVGLLYGRRRQGKSFLLRRLAEAAGGLYHQAHEEAREPALARFAGSVGQRAGLPPEVLRPADWGAALRTLLGAAQPPRLVVLDEFPYLVRHSPELPSVLQELVDERRHASGPPVRLVLCGSAISVMGQLLSGAQALRGRAVLDLHLRPFDHRTAARFWDVSDPAVALHLWAILGGTPGYRDLLAGPAPRTIDELGDWLAHGVLDPSHALFREAEYVLTEDPRLVDRALYQSVLQAISRGATRAAQVAAALGRDQRSLEHPVRTLEAAGFLRRDADVLLDRRPSLAVADPLVRFSHLVIRPRMEQFEDRRTAAAWADARASFDSGVLGPAFEELARAWTRGLDVGAVGRTEVSDRSGRSRHEVDVIGLAPGQTRHPATPDIRVLGEARASRRPLTLADVRRLERIRGLLQVRGARVERCRLLLFARGGFDAALRDAARSRDDLSLIDPERLYAPAPGSP